MPVLRGSASSAGSLALLHDGVSSALHMALCQGDQIVGVHTAAYHGRTEPFTAQELRIARGIAQTASMALNNARLVEEVERATHVKSEFLSTMSHELRTPLAALLGYAEILAEADSGAAEHQHCVQRIRAVGTDLLELIESTLEMGRAEAGRDELRFEAVRVRPFWETLAVQCGKMPRHAEVLFDWSADVPDVVIVTDPRKLSVVLRNLISNALKFTERGVVRLDAQLDGDALTFCISDTGVGIPSDERSTIFEMFRQGTGSEARRHSGTGLGLYIVRRFVEQLGGAVDLESTPGGGSTFIVRLPRHQVGATGDLDAAPAARA
jgi:signal transduction histidine kinase